MLVSRTKDNTLVCSRLNKGDSFCRNRFGGLALSQFVFSSRAIYFPRYWNQLAKIAIRLKQSHADLLVQPKKQPNV
jgi:hypothetical protein